MWLSNDNILKYLLCRVILHVYLNSNDQEIKLTKENSVMLILKPWATVFFFYIKPTYSNLCQIWQHILLYSVIIKYHSIAMEKNCETENISRGLLTDITSVLRWNSNFCLPSALAGQSLPIIRCSQVINPSTPKIVLVILITVCYTNLVILVWKIWYWIN